MTLKSALQDVRETTLAAVSGLLGKLAYLGSLRRMAGRYQHWGMDAVHGPEAAERALKAAHVEVVTNVLRTPIANLLEDVEVSRRDLGADAPDFVEDMRDHISELLPPGKQDSPSATHLSSVLLALLKLEKNREGATRSIS